MDEFERCLLAVGKGNRDSGYLTSELPSTD